MNRKYKALSITSTDRNKQQNINKKNITSRCSYAKIKLKEEKPNRDLQKASNTKK